MCMVAARRSRGADPPDAMSIRRFMRAVQAPGTTLEDPCVGTSDLGRHCSCARTAMEPFYAALDATAAGDARTGIVVFGTSLIAADGITDVIRERLVHRFADAGRGLLLADRLADVGPRTRTAAVASGWRPETCASGAPPHTPLGATGVQHVSEGRAFSRFKLSGEREATIFWGGQPGLSLRVDDGPWRPIDTSQEPEQSHGVTRLALEPSDKVLTLRAERDGVVVQGVSLERGGAGVVLDTLGVPAADARLWLTVDEDNFQRQLAARAPSLVMIMLGGNEAKRISWGRSTTETIERDLRALIARVRSVNDGACLVVGPIDAVVGPDHDDPWRERPSLRPVIDIERDVAVSEGCAYFDLYEAMGGRGSLRRLAEVGAVWDDLVHPRGRGLDMLGQLIVDALLDGYARSQPTSAVERNAQMSLGGT
jgi:lysophospholipase L1-like esterase